MAINLDVHVVLRQYSTVSVQHYVVEQRFPPITIICINLAYFIVIFVYNPTFCVINSPPSLHPSLKGVRRILVREGQCPLPHEAKKSVKI